MNLIVSKDIENVNMLDYDNNFDLEYLLKNYVGRERVKTFLRNQYKQIKTRERRRKYSFRIRRN